MANGTEPEKSSIWLEVANVRLNRSQVNSTQVEILVKGDKADQDVWRNVDLNQVGFGDVTEAYRAITEGLDKKRVVIASLAALENKLDVSAIRIQYAESNSR